MEENIVESDYFEQYLISHPFLGKPEILYNAMNYIMQLGGKRVRPKLLLLAYRCVSGKLNDDAARLALAIETFHNFSLVHDDIMDNAPLRRGKKTVHEEWDNNVAILAGDNLLIKCFELILKTGFKNREKLLEEFSEMASQVCEGQQMDISFPLQERINEEEYLKMIRLKTAVLPACALKMGALAAGADAERAGHFYDFGLNLGMAFQLQDDYLDSFGNSEDTGKQVGGDIIENKRTILYIRAMQTLEGEERNELSRWFNGPAVDAAAKVDRVRELFSMAESDAYLLSLKSEFEHHAFICMEKACDASANRGEFTELFDFLKARNN